MIAQAVIGASYGDEGKGRTVDRLAAPHGPAALVVRSNGGAQAGHTVVAPDGSRHVFHHVGAGSLRGARTHLSRFMVSNPILFAAERAALARLGIDPRVSADRRGWVTTPWDMMVNQALEMARGGGRHGSCGLGFGETIGRCEQADVPLEVGDLGASNLPARLRAIRDDWLPRRRAGLEMPPGGPFDHAGAPLLFERFVEQCRGFARAVSLRDDADLRCEPALIFEAAQGLLLDQDSAGFPFVTRSRTGLANIAAIAREAELAAVQPTYVTRAYLTRHGRGPMEDERAIERWYAADDPTNRPNPWQESLRFGLLDPAALAGRIVADGATMTDLAITPRLAVTCLDQACGDLTWLEQGSIVRGARAALLDRLTAATAVPVTAFAAAANLC